MKDKPKPAFLILKDGSIYPGTRFGSENNASGEVVFTTSMNGYVESISDPSYKGQMLVITHPLVGNYGVPKKIFRNGILANFESGKIQINGLIVSEITHNKEWNADKSLAEWLEEEDVPGIAGIDTRALTLHIRKNGSMPGIIAKAKDAIKFENYEKINFVEMVSVKKPVIYKNKGPTIAVIDYGLKEGILENLYALGYTLIRLPYNVSESEVLSFNPAGIVLTNGPGNPKLLGKEIKTVGALLEHKIPTLGICLGHQLVCMSIGAKVAKMKFGHHAINKGVINLKTGKAIITTHNHGYEVSGPLPKSFEPLYRCIDDNTIEGTISEKFNTLTVQFHPEARPGTKDAEFIFKEFSSMMKGVH